MQQKWQRLQKLLMDGTISQVSSVLLTMGEASVADTALRWTSKKNNRTGGPRHSRALSIQPKILEILVRNQMERTILVGSDQNIWDHLEGGPLWSVWCISPKYPLSFYLT